MSKINSLPEGEFWSLQFLKGVPTLFTKPRKIFALYSDEVCDLLEGVIVSHEPAVFISALLSKESEEHLIFHAFYELGTFWEGRLEKKTLLGYWMLFDERSELCETFFESKANDIKLEWSVPGFEEYEKAFERGLHHLKRGDCYQYNLTFPFKAKGADFILDDFLIRLWRKKEARGEFASFTQVGEIGLYCNSPECLFDIEEGEEGQLLQTRPIKGTIRIEDGQDWQEAWQELSHCPKNESELYMITDLLRNDLNAIEEPCVKVVHKKAPLVVPGLLHSFSELQIRLSKDVTLFEVMRSLFPGGSITGAPKKRVMQIIEDLEKEDRGFYCGSTVVRSEKTYRASINIRGGILDKSEICLTYHAGSGVTFESTLEGEYREMRDKHKSLTKLLTNEIS